MFLNGCKIRRCAVVVPSRLDEAAGLLHDELCQQPWFIAVGVAETIEPPGKQQLYVYIKRLSQASLFDLQRLVEFGWRGFEVKVRALRWRPHARYQSKAWQRYRRSRETDSSVPREPEDCY
jgi:hypothetical protein